MSRSRRFYRWGAQGGPGVWVVGVLLTYGTFPACRCLAQGHGPTSVEVAPVVLRDIAPTIRLVGTVRPRLRTVVASEVAGLVAELPAEEGDRVAKGQVICRLRDARRRFAHGQALARQAELTAAVAVRTAELAKAQFEKERTARLWEQHRCTDKERQDSQAEYDAALARVEQARQAVEAQKAVVAIAADDLARTVIRAPCDGHIVAKRTEIGSWVDEGGEVFDLVDLSTVRVRVAVPESIIGFCQVGAVAQVSVEALGKVYPGRISRVIPDADERARTFPVEIDLANAAGELKAGMFVRSAVPSGPKAERLVVPKDAVVVRGPLSMIYVVRGSEEGRMAVPTPVEILSEVMDHVAVQAQGLSSGDQVVVRGNEYMFGPTAVSVMSAPEGTTTQPGESARSGARKETPKRQNAEASKQQ